MLTKILVSIVFYLFYWFCCCLGTGTDRKNLGGLRSYPDTVQQAVREHPVLGLFDLVIIDLLWWRNTRRIRFSFLLEKTPYQDPGKHIGSFLRGIPLFAVVAVISAADISPAVGWKV